MNSSAGTQATSCDYSRIAVVKVFNGRFNAGPSINKPLLRELVKGDELDKRDNILRVGPSGTGKTHLALALGIAAGESYRLKEAERRRGDRCGNFLNFRRGQFLRAAPAIKLHSFRVGVGR